jgi:hypothetical protein
MKHLYSFLLLSLVSIGLCSCQSPSRLPAPASESAPPETAAPPENAATGRTSAELTYTLARQTWCSNDEAASLILLLVHGQDPFTSFEQRQAALISQGFISPSWKLQATEPVTKGTLAYMLCRALDMKGGLFFRLAPCRRYAYREAVYQALMMRGSEFEPLTGPEVVGIMGTAGRLKAGQTLQKKS